MAIQCDKHGCVATLVEPPCPLCEREVKDASIATLEAECERLNLDGELARRAQVALSQAVGLQYITAWPELTARVVDAIQSAEAALVAAREENERLKRSMDNRREMRWVDMTPDAGLGARILSAYIDNTSCTDNLAGLDPESFVCKMMNENTAQRNVLLKAALAALRASQTDAGRLERVREALDIAAQDCREYDMTAVELIEKLRAVLAADGREP